MGRKPTGNPKGRPKGTGRLGAEVVRLTVRIPEELYQRFLAFAEGRSFHRGDPQLSNCARDALAHYLACPDKRLTGNGPAHHSEYKRQINNGIVPFSEYKRQIEKSTQPQYDNKRQTDNALVSSVLTVNEEPSPLVQHSCQTSTWKDSLVGPDNSISVLLHQTEKSPTPSEDTGRAQRRALLLSAVPWEADTPGGVSPADIRRATGLRKTDVANDLRDLGEAGEVRKVSKGIYVRPRPAPVA